MWPFRGIVAALERPSFLGSWHDGKTMRNPTALLFQLQRGGFLFLSDYNSRSSSHHAINQGNIRVPGWAGSGKGGKFGRLKRMACSRWQRLCALLCAFDLARRLAETPRDMKPDSGPGAAKRFLIHPPPVPVARWIPSFLHLLGGRGGGDDEWMAQAQAPQMLTVTV